MKEQWEIRLTARTNTLSGKVRTINRVLPDANYQTIIDAVNDRPNAYEFYGDLLVITTPLHRTEYVIDPDTLELKCLS